VIVQFRNDTGRRFGIAIALAILGAVLLTIFAAPAEAQVHYPNFCAGLGPGDLDYWLFSCWAMR
jgi:hypothetical protein